MAVQLSTIRAAVRSILDETSQADWLDTDLTRVINQRYHRVYTAVVAIFEDYKISTDLINTVASQQEYTSADGLNTDIFKIRRVEINYDITNTNSIFQRAYPLNEIDRVRVRLGETNLSLRGPSYYYIGGTLGFLPIPDKTGTSAIKYWYVPTLADLSSDSSTIDLPYPERYYHLIVEGAASDALRFGQQESAEADKLDAKFVAGVILMQEELEDKVAEETKSVMDVGGDSLDFGY